MIDKQTRIDICGIGPGSPNFISSEVFKRIEFADVLIGGKRQLEIFVKSHALHCPFNGKLEELKQSILIHKGKNITVLVSGDTGFYSLRRFLTHEFSEADIHLVPGISSFQYFYAQLGLGYENALLDSMHGKQSNFQEKVTNCKSIFLLTDKTNNWKTIAQTLVDSDKGHYPMHIGNRLSYADEQIVSLPASEALKQNYEFPLCAVIIVNPDWNER